jgi:outer membrane usher protein
VTRGASERTTASGYYRGHNVDVQGVAVDTGDTTAVSAAIMGAVATLDNRVYTAARIDDAFGVVDVGMPSVPVFLHNRPLGITDDAGRIFVPNLLSYHQNKIVIDPSVLPPDTEAATVEKVVVPRRRSGVTVDMKVKPAQPSAIVQFVRPEGEPVPVGSVGRLEGAEDEFIVGYDGQAFIPKLGARNSAVIQLPEGSCSASFDYKARPGEQVQITRVLCR